MKSRITIKDIARELHLHHSTVSRALRNDHRVKEETRNKILDYSRKQGYEVNMNALQLRGHIKNVIAVIVPNINHSFFANVVSHITNLSATRGYIVSVFQTNEQLEKEINIIDTIIRHNISGVVASVTMETKTSDHFKKLQEYEIPLVFFDRIQDGLKVPRVMVNNKTAILVAMNILFDKACEKILHISGPQHLNVFYERRQGYLEGLHKHGINKGHTIDISKGFTVEDGQKELRRYLKINAMPDAIICDSVVLLIGILLELRKMKIKIPEEVKIVCFSGGEPLELFNPEIISIYQPSEVIAKHAFELLIQSMNELDKVSNQEVWVEAIVKQNINFK